MRKFLALALVAGCTEMTDYFPDAETVSIEGREFFVAPRPTLGPGVYLAGPNDAQPDEVFLGRGFTLPVANVAAIEKVSGCPVIRETIRNQNTGTTFAAVRCG